MSGARTEPSRKGWRVLLTGGSGFIGTHMTGYYLSRGAAVLNLDIAPPLDPAQESCWRRQDILDADGMRDAFREFGPTHVVHLAARADLDEKHDVNAYVENIQGVRNVLDAVSRTGSVGHVIVASTMFVCPPGYRPASDQDYCPHTVYGESKVLTEKITRESGLDCRWTIVRPAMIWGPWHMRMRGEFFRVLRKGLYFHPGSTRARRSYGYVGNTVFQMDRIFAAQPERVDRKVFYLADPPVSLFEWTDGFSRRLAGRPVRSMPYFMMKGLALFGDALGMLGWDRFPMTSFRLDNMTRDNIVDTDPINAIAWPLPFSVADGTEATVRWLEGLGDDA